MRDRARGFDHEDEVLRQLRRLHNGVVDIERGPQAVHKTLEVMRAGAPVITSARLESEHSDAVGAPDLLIWVGDGYAAVEIKNHKIIGPKGIPAVRTSLKEIARISSDDQTKFRGFRRRDLVQVAHYHRLLNEAGVASISRMGGVIGSDDPIGCLWVDMSEGEPSISDTYRASFAAAEATILAGRNDPDTPLNEPWWRTECQRCDWADLCSSQLTARNDVTLLRRVDDQLRVRLAAEGITRIDEVAALPSDDERLPEPSVVFQARARTANGLLRRDREGTALQVPAARREVDFDIETYGGQIYLAGFLVTEGGEPSFEPIVDWTGTTEGEADVVARMFAKLAGMGDDNTVVFHWTDYEQRTLAAAGSRHGLRIRDDESVDAWFDRHAVDLCAWTRNTLVSPNGFGLKAIAPLCGFEWRDDDPGGRQSEIWFEHVLEGDHAMRDRLLAYNEDDVIAQLKIRQWIRSQNNGAGPGSAIPSVHSRLWRPESQHGAHTDVRDPSVDPTRMRS